MKRLLPAIICALALHAIILSTDFSWLKLGPHPAPASRSLSITLSADKLPKRDARTTAAISELEKRFQPDLQHKPVEKIVEAPAAARLENSARIQNRLQPTPPKNTVRRRI